MRDLVANNLKATAKLYFGERGLLPLRNRDPRP